MRPTILKLADGGRRYVEAPPEVVRNAIRHARVNGHPDVRIRGVPPFPPGGVLAVDDVLLDDTGHPVPAAAMPRSQTAIRFADGGQVLVTSTPKKIHRAIQRALERGDIHFTISDQRFRIDAIRAIDGEPFEA